MLADGDGRIVLANQQLERQFGYSHGELIGQRVEALIPNAVRLAGGSGAGASTPALTTDASDVEDQLFGQRRDGSRFPVDVTLSQLRTDDGCFVLASVGDDRAGRKQDQAYEETISGQREFERLIADMSAQFINVPPDAVDDAMRTALTQIGHTLDLDRATFFRVAGGWHAGRSGGLARATRVPPIPDPMPAALLFPWALETLQAGEVVCFSSIDEIPNPIDRESYRSLGIRSAVTVPLAVGGRIVGAVGFNSFRRERAWSADELHMLRVFATAFGNVLARRESDKALRDGPRRGDAAARSAAGRERLSACRSPRPLGRRQRPRGERGDPPAPSSWSIRCRPPIRPCCCSARPAPARSCSPRGSTI